MRVLFTCVSATGHFHPLVPVARALVEAGHHVMFAASAALAPLVEGAGFQHTPAGLDLRSPEMAPVWTSLGQLTDRLERERLGIERGFAGILAERMAADLIAGPASRRVDLIVRENMEFGGCLAAERLGLPHAAVAVLAAGFQPRWREVLVGPLERLRAAHGLPPDPHLEMLSRYLTLHPFPSSFQETAPLPTDWTIRPTPFDRSGDEALPRWVSDLPARPTVYATLGTVFNDRTDLFRAFLEGLRDEPINLIVTVGRNQDPAQFGPQPEHIRIEPYIPQSQLLPYCDLVLTHGGSGTVMAALAQGLPLVVMPLGADQPENAARVAALNVGRVIEAGASTPAAIRAAVRTILADASYRRNAERLRDEIQALPGPERAVALLERLASQRRALLTAA